jgi:hypothetical protein
VRAAWESALRERRALSPPARPQLRRCPTASPALAAATPDYAPAAIGLLPGDGDEYIVTEGGMTGQRGFFTRDETGAIVGVDLAGRLFTRVPPPPV